MYSKYWTVFTKFTCYSVSYVNSKILVAGGDFRRFQIIMTGWQKRKVQHFVTETALSEDFHHEGLNRGLTVTQ